MKAYKAEELRAFTEALFRGDSFDRFLLLEASFQTAFSLELDGRVAKDWYSEEERQSRGVEDFVRWGEVKTLAFQAIRGKRAPIAFRVVLRLDLAESTAFLAESGSKLRPQEFELRGENAPHCERCECQSVPRRQGARATLGPERCGAATGNGTGNRRTVRRQA